MADALASEASGGNPVEVQVLSRAPQLKSRETIIGFAAFLRFNEPQA